MSKFSYEYVNSLRHRVKILTILIIFVLITQVFLLYKLWSYEQQIENTIETAKTDIAEISKSVEDTIESVKTYTTKQGFNFFNLSGDEEKD